MRKYKTFWKRLAAAMIDSVLFLPYVFFATTHKYYYYGVELSYILIWTAYSTYCHGKYGQTLGKRLTGIAVLDVGEASLIGYKRAFLREVLWFLVSLALLVYSFAHSGNDTLVAEEVINHYDVLLSVVTVGWLVTELVTMLLNAKRRAIHDYMAQSVVIDVNAPDDATLLT